MHAAADDYRVQNMLMAILPATAAGATQVTRRSYDGPSAVMPLLSLGIC
jgi:hypothetical protein